jgi:hypothetical protein
MSIKDRTLAAIEKFAKVDAPTHFKPNRSIRVVTRAVTGIVGHFRIWDAHEAAISPIWDDQYVYFLDDEYVPSSQFSPRNLPKGSFTMLWNKHDHQELPLRIFFQVPLLKGVMKVQTQASFTISIPETEENLGIMLRAILHHPIGESIRIADAEDYLISLGYVPVYSDEGVSFI